MSRIWARRPGRLESKVSEGIGVFSAKERSFDEVGVRVRVSRGGEAREDDDDLVVLLLGVLGISLSFAILILILEKIKKNKNNKLKELVMEVGLVERYLGAATESRRRC